jgi:hypothetical protein
MFERRGCPAWAIWILEACRTNTHLWKLAAKRIAWLMIDHRNNAEIAVFITGVLYGLLPTAAVLLIMIVLIGLGTPVPIAVGLSVAACGCPVWVVWSLERFGRTYTHPGEISRSARCS